jgi:hypothetical protein
MAETRRVPRTAVPVVPIGGVGSDSRKGAVRRYFRRTPDPDDERRALLLLNLAGLAVLLAAALLLVGPWPAAAVTGLVGLVVLAQGLMQRSSYRRRYAAAEPKPTDAQLDELLREDLHRASERALQRLGLVREDLELRSHDVGGPAGSRVRRLADQGSGPIAVFGPHAQAQARAGADRTWRFATYDVMVICPTAHHLGIYECVLDMASGRRRDEETHEYHYADVVAVRTTTTARPEVAINLLDVTAHHRISLGRTLQREFQVVVSSGDRSSIIVGIVDEDEPRDAALLPDSGVESVLHAVRRVLRVKKGGVIPSA